MGLVRGRKTTQQFMILMTKDKGFRELWRSGWEFRDWQGYHCTQGQNPDGGNHSTVYLQAPFELRYFANKLNRNQGFKAAIGLQVGTLLGAHTKGLRSVDGTNVKDKENTKNFVSNWNFAATARVGWGHFAIYGSYNLTNVFKQNEGPAVTPYSVGIALTGL